MFKVTKESLEILEKISEKINDQTFHHHYHILYDIANSYDTEYKITYLEIGCYAGGSACLMLQRPNTDVISIDLGRPIKRDVVIENTNKLNVHKNNYTYIEGDSHNPNTINDVKTLLNETLLDILFIDGDHSFDGVISDFNIYSKLVKEGGYIVFDDYNDILHSPKVKTAVDSLPLDNYKILGVFGSEFEARPKELNVGNEYVIKKNKNTNV